MRLTASLLSGVGLACLLVACGVDPDGVATSPSPIGSTPSEESGRGASVAGRGGGGGGGGAGQDHGIVLELSGGIVATAQTAVIDRDTKSSLKVLVGAELTGEVFADEFRLGALAGDPTPTALGGCLVSPSDTPMAVVQRLIQRLDDPWQERDRLVVEIDTRSLGQESARHILTHNWTDGDGTSYRTWLIQSDHARDRLITVTQLGADVYEFSGGSIVNWDTDADVVLVCPNGGSIRVTFTR